MPQTYIVVVEPVNPGQPPVGVMPPIYYPPYLPTLPSPQPPTWGGGGQPYPPGSGQPGGPGWTPHPEHPIPPGIWGGAPGQPSQPPGFWGPTDPRPSQPIYFPEGGHVMPPIDPGGEPTHPIEIPPGSWVMPPRPDNTLPGQEHPEHPMAPGGRPEHPIAPGGRPPRPENTPPPGGQPTPQQRR